MCTITAKKTTSPSPPLPLRLLAPRATPSAMACITSPNVAFNPATPRPEAPPSASWHRSREAVLSRRHVEGKSAVREFERRCAGIPVGSVWWSEGLVGM